MHQNILVGEALVEDQPIGLLERRGLPVRAGTAVKMTIAATTPSRVFCPDSGARIVMGLALVLPHRAPETIV